MSTPSLIRSIVPRLSTLPGVAQVLIFGTQKYAVRVRADLDQLAVRGLSLAEIADRGRQRQLEDAGRLDRPEQPQRHSRSHRADHPGRRLTCR